MKSDMLFSGVHRMLFVTMLLIPAIPLLVAAGVGFYSFVKTTERFAVGTIEQSAADHRQLVNGFLNERRGDLESFLALARPEALSGKTAEAEIGAFRAVGGSAFSDMGLIDPSGVQTAYVGPYALQGKDYRQADWYVETLKKGYFISDVYLGYRNVPHFVIAVARRMNGGVWVLRATVDSALFGRIVEKVSVGDSGEAYILNNDGVLQTRRRTGGDLLEKDVFVYPAQVGGVMAFMGDVAGDDYLFASASMNDGKWRLIVRQKRDEAFESTTVAVYTVLVILLVGGAIILWLALVVSRRVVDTLKRQAEAMGKLENQLLQAARLAELGEMSAGFAHEINNPLQIMKADLALLDLDVEDLLAKGESSELCKEIKEVAEQFRLQIDRCAGITREILRFGRQDAPQLQPINLLEYLPKVGAMIQNKASVNGIAMTCEVDRSVPVIQADPGQMQQVMINLLNNAIYAVVDRHGVKGGEIAVDARADDAGNAIIRVRDNGSGMSKETMEKIFIPFYTTKAPGQGTGMGLSVCYSIIDSLGGELSVESRKGEGTTFTIKVPAMRN
ncbi:ATP-binding protein [Pseudodesulfovibrio sp.]|uniref:sensor histidine kinase n=1 Tax=Pseudodesulfovibrio sp. TaxID=2035812 RepID=UPI002623D6A8|nr:ATP-binding protein [Pseudodesulfovibrio sp.]MDD3310737.1 ATP-binding protein [Pseudodesulfovibrio sp.]